MSKTFTRMGLALMAFAALFATACEEAPINEVIKVDPPSVTIKAEGGSATVSAQIPLAWSVSINASWVSMTPSSGDKGTYTFVFTAEKNETGETRTAQAVVSVSVPDATVPPVPITITQPSVTVDPPQPPVTPTISFSPTTSYELDADGGAVRFIVTSNVAWTVENSLPAFTVAPTSGQAGETGVVVTVPQNTTQEARQAVLTFHYGDKTAQVTVSQAAPKAPEPSLTFSSGDKLTIGHQGGRLTLKVTSNVAWTATTEAADVTINPAGGSAGETAIVIEVGANTVESNRVTHITFAYAGKTATLTITQEAAPHQENPPVGIGSEVKGWEYGGNIVFEEVDIH